MRREGQPLYMIGVAAQLCNVHPQTLRQYEKLGLISPARVGAKNRLFSELDIARVKRIQRLTQELGVNLAGVEIILKLLDDLDDVRNEMERQMDDFRRDAEERIQQLLAGSNLPIRKDETLLPTPHLTWRRVEL